MDPTEAPVPGPPATPLFQARNLTVEYPAVRALDHVDFELARGEIHALLGENGAGKTTLINVLSGLVQPKSAELSLRGKPFLSSSPRDAESAGISTVHQELDLIPTLSIAENICLGRSRGILSWRNTHARAKSALSRLGTSLKTRRLLGSCSTAEQQLVAIARALDVDAKVLILDEPTSSLDAAESQSLFNILRHLRGKGLGIILITHFLDQVYQIADRITVLRNGKRVGTWPAAELPRAGLIESMTGRTLETAASISGASGPRAPQDKFTTTQNTAPLLHFSNLSRRNAISPTSASIHNSESIGLAGLLGSGRTELARLIFGADDADSGSISLDNQPFKQGSIPHSIRRGIAMLPEDRKSQGLFLDLSIRENIILAFQARRGGLRPISTSEQQRLADHYIQALRIKAPSSESPVRTLSGGNQQKVLLARWLAIQPRLLILDEPARGIDVGARAEIESLIASLREQGMSILLISSEVDEVVRICTRALILRDRKCIGELSGPDLTEPAILARIAEPASRTSS